MYTLMLMSQTYSTVELLKFNRIDKGASMLLCRWQRAAKFGLNPPQQVLELLTGPEGEQRNNNIWDGRV